MLGWGACLELAALRAAPRRPTLGLVLFLPFPAPEAPDPKPPRNEPCTEAVLSHVRGLAKYSGHGAQRAFLKTQVCLGQCDLRRRERDARAVLGAFGL